jgi:two-component system NtrC family sensor kinase
MIPRDRRTALLVAGAALLLMALAFLFVRTQSTGYKDQVQALSLLRELRDADLRWDADALRIANDLGATQAAVADRGAIIGRIFQELQHGNGQTQLAAQVPHLRAGMAAKQEAFRSLRTAHATSLEALATAREALMTAASEATALRARDPRNAERVAAFVAQVEQLRAGIRTADIEAQADISRGLEPAIATLVPAAATIDARLGPLADRAGAATGRFLAARAAEADAWRKFTFITTGGRAEMMAQSLARDIEAALEDKDRWRAYLFAYATALLIGVAYLVTRVIATQAELRRANDELEARVADRTRELRQTLSQLRESEAQLVQTEKMSSLGQLVAGVAHEINTPLAYVKNSVSTVRGRMPELRDAIELANRLLQLLASESADPGDLQGTFDRLSARLAQIAEHQVLEDLDSLAGDGMHGIEAISELVTNLRNFSRLDRSRIASFSVNDGVNAALLIAKPHLRKVDTEKRLGDVPSITCSPSQVNQVLLNIVTNAAQAIDKPRGMIHVTTRMEGGDHVAIDIADNGKGIPADSLTRIFDPFYTTKAPGQGTGLGLSIAYKIVSQHGGRIDVSSEVGTGSTFTVVLPIRPSAEFVEEASKEKAA